MSVARGFESLCAGCDTSIFRINMVVYMHICTAGSFILHSECTYGPHQCTVHVVTVQAELLRMRKSFTFAVTDACMNSCNTVYLLSNRLTQFLSYMQPFQVSGKCFRSVCPVGLKKKKFSVICVSLRCGCSHM